MTTYEHLMLAGSLVLASGVQRRHGWAIVAGAGVGATLPDLDGLSLAFGPQAYAQVHRVWGHNLLVSAGLGIAAGAVGYWCFLTPRVRSWVQARLPRRSPQDVVSEEPTPRFSRVSLAVWVATGFLAGVCHLPADLVYAGHPDMLEWPLPLLWPFSEQRWSWPLIAWGDLTATGVFVGEMFALYCWPQRAQILAVVTLLLLLASLTLRVLLSQCM